MNVCYYFYHHNAIILILKIASSHLWRSLWCKELKCWPDRDFFEIFEIFSYPMLWNTVWIPRIRLYFLQLRDYFRIFSWSVSKIRHLVRIHRFQMNSCNCPFTAKQSWNSSCQRTIDLWKKTNAISLQNNDNWTERKFRWKKKM